MKSVSEELSNYLNREKNMICNDLIELHLADGTVLYYTNAIKLLNITATYTSIMSCCCNANR